MMMCDHVDVVTIDHITGGMKGDRKLTGTRKLEL